jgi:high-affinity iron transporter
MHARIALLLLSAWLTTTASVWAAPDGKALFSQNCASCHGAKGMGDGPDAGYYDTPPASLAAPSYKHGTSDAEVLKTIDEGIHGSPMPGFKTKLSEDDRKALVAYLKTLRGK